MPEWKHFRIQIYRESTTFVVADRQQQFDFTAPRTKYIHTIEAIILFFYLGGYRYRKDVRETNTGGDESRAVGKHHKRCSSLLNLPSSK